MNLSIRFLTATRTKRVLASAFACGLALGLPACHLPPLRQPDPGPELPGSFDVATGAPPAMVVPPAVPMPQPTRPAAPGVLPAAPAPAPNVLPTAATVAAPAEARIATTGPTIITTGGTTIIAPGGATVISAAVAPPAARPAAVAGATLTPVGGVTDATTGLTIPIPTTAAVVGGPACVPPPAGTVASNNSALVGVDEFFTDPQLQALIQQGLAGNRELKAIDQEIQIASNEVLARRGAYLPMASFGALSGFDKTSKYTRNGAVEDQLLLPPRFRTFPDPLPDTRVGVDVTWQLDIWRMLRNSRDAAIQRYIAARERRNAFVTRLVADVAENYYELMALDKRIENLDQTITLQEQSYEAYKQKLEVGKGTNLSVQRFLAEVRKNQGEKLAIRQEIIETENRINFLLNRYPQPVERSKADFYDLTIHDLSLGLPADLLANRPDIRQAERELAAAGLDVKVARARFYPALTISAGVGYEAFNPRYLFNPEAFAANVVGGLVAPLVNKKAIQADYLTANARQLQAVYNYQRIVLNAFTEVVNRVAMAENYRKNVELRKQQTDALTVSVDAATQLYQNARAEYIEVLFAQRDLRDARSELINAKRQQLTAIVNTYQALGGGTALGTATQPTVVSATKHPWVWTETTDAAGPKLPPSGKSWWAGWFGH